MGKQTPALPSRPSQEIQTLVKSAIHRYTGFLIVGGLTSLFGLMFQLYGVNVNYFGFGPPTLGSISQFLVWLLSGTIAFAIVGIFELTHAISHPVDPTKGRGK